MLQASIVVLTYNGLEQATRPCIESVLRHTDLTGNELICVDNASQDGTPDFLRTVAEQPGNIRLQLNTSNRGYAGGNNDGMRMAQGRYIVLLNNDVLVSDGWLDKLLRLLGEYPRLGMVGPITNSAGNEQRVEIKGLNEDNFERAAAGYLQRQAGHWFIADKLGFFCVALRRSLLDKIGFLDENFGLGMFEDDDFCLRVRHQAKLKLAVAEDCFVFHKGSVSFKKLSYDEYHGLFERNKAYFRQKHAIDWTFSDLALSYWDKFDQDLKASVKTHQQPDPALERILVRFENFKHLLIQVHQAEIANRAPNRVQSRKTISQAGNQGRWQLRWEIFQREFLRGSSAQKTHYMAAVLKAATGRPPVTPTPPSFDFTPLVTAVSEIRQRIAFEKVLIVPATIDFHYMKQRPQQLAQAFAEAGYLVIYGTLNHRTDKVDVYEQISDRLFLLNDKYFSYLHHVFTPQETTYYCLWPNNAKYLEHIKFSKLLYDFMDELSILELPLEQTQPQHELLLKTADLITVSAYSLLAQIPDNYRAKTLLINNAVEQAFIDQVRQAEPSEALCSLAAGRRIVGYFGAIAQWFDFDLVADLAAAKPELVFYFIGPIIQVESEVQALESEYSNIRFFPPVSHAEIPAILQAFDVCIIPFVKNSVTDAVSPVKLFEYLSAGKPVITSNLQECKQYPQVYIAKSASEFLEELDDALQKTDDAGFCAELTAVAECNTWTARVNAICQQWDGTNVSE